MVELSCSNLALDDSRKYIINKLNTRYKPKLLLAKMVTELSCTQDVIVMYSETDGGTIHRSTAILPLTTVSS